MVEFGIRAKGSSLTFGIAVRDEMMMNVHSAKFGTAFGRCHISSSFFFSLQPKMTLPIALFLRYFSPDS